MKRTITNVDETIQKCWEYSISNPYWSKQIGYDGKNHRAFHLRLIELSHKHFLEQLLSMQRQPTSKTLDELLDILDRSDFIFSGIKIVHFPIMRLYEWDKWDDGYVEGYCRFSVSNGPDYFIWTYIEMKHLRTILEEHKDEMEIYE